MSSSLRKIPETPRGELEWVIISGEGKEDLQGNMKYQASLVLDPKDPEHQAYLESIEDYWEENKPAHISEAKSTGVYDHKAPKLDDEGNPVKGEDGKVIMELTGKKLVLFKTGTEYADGKAKVVKVYNGKNKQVVLGDRKIGNGTIGRLAGAMDIYEVKGKGKNTKAVEAGVTHYLDAVKIIKFKEYISGPNFSQDDDAEDWDEDDVPFGDEEAPAEAAGKPRL